MKIEVKNNWESLTYFFDGKEIPVNEGGQVILQGGEIIDYKFEPFSTSYRDWGRTYGVKTHKLIGIINIKGQSIETDLTKLDILRFLD